jgi:hypothetical protein
MTDPEGVRTRRGRPRSVNLSAIVSTARALPADEVSLTRVADELGVDRKTIANRVGDLPGLRRLIASEAVASELAQRTAERSDDWREALRDQADAMVKAVIEVGVPDIEFEGAEWELTLLHVAEHSIGRLREAGFDADTAIAAVSIVTDIASSAARRILRAGERGELALSTLPEVLSAIRSDAFPAVREVMATTTVHDEDGRYRHAIELFIGNLDKSQPREALLHEEGRSP